MEEKQGDTNNQIGRFANDNERRIFVATYERCQREGIGVEMSMYAADQAVLGWRRREG